MINTYPDKDPLKAAQDYQRVEQLIHYLNMTEDANANANANANASLKALAQHIGETELHVQRLFSRWAGISPKRFSQYLTIKEIKSYLAKRPSLLDVSLDAGLSSTSRVHESFINFYAMTPKQVRDQGKGMIIHHGFYPSPFGICHIGSTKHGICWMAFIDPITVKASTQQLINEWQGAQLVRDDQYHLKQLSILFDMDKLKKPLFLHVKGTNFQLRVWEALLKIPSGAYYTYQDIAKTIEQPLASRAVGSAIAKNPISWLIPCHRVIRASGVIGNYRWGSVRKQSLLAWERAQLG